VLPLLKVELIGAKATSRKAKDQQFLVIVKTAALPERSQVQSTMWREQVRPGRMSHLKL
jgi:hypothetical protein